MHVPISPRRRAHLAVALLAVAAATLMPPPASVAAATTATTTTVTSSENPAIVGGMLDLTVAVTPASGTAAPTGTVTIDDGSTSVGALGLDGGGRAVLHTSSLGVGSHSLTAVYAGDGANDASTSSPLAETVQPSTTATTLTASPTQAGYGDQVNVFARVDPSTSPVTFRFSSDASDPLGHGTTASYGLADASIAVGGTTSSLGFSVNGGGGIIGVSLAAPAGQQLHPGTYTNAQKLTSPAGSAPGLDARTSLTGFASSDCQTVSGGFTIDALVADQSGNVTAIDASFDVYCGGAAGGFHGSVHIAGTAPPSGTVSFMDGATTVATWPLDGERTGVTLTRLAPGTHQITAVYSGDANYGGSSSAATTVAISTRPVLSVAPNPAAYMAPVTITASIPLPTQSSPVATGTITFQNYGRTLGTATLDSTGHASLTSALSYSAELVADYGGDQNYPPGSSLQFGEQVDPNPPSSITFASTPARPAVGDAVDLTATLTVPAGAPAPTGSVLFQDGSATLGTGTVDASGTATVTVSSLSLGTHSLTATYEADQHYSWTYASLSLTVVPAAFVALTSSTEPSVPGQHVTFVAAVSTQDGGTATGTVSFSDGSTALGSVTVDAGGIAALTVALDSGTHDISASYSGDATYGDAQDAITQTVVAATADRRFVNQLYNDILGRPATDSDAARWVSLLDNRVTDRSHVALALTTSTEFISDQVEGSYLAHLGRDADPQGLAFWVGYIQHGATFEDLEISFLGTPEYYSGAAALYPGRSAAEAFVDAVYNDVLGRSPDSQGLGYWVARLNSGDPAWHLAASVVKSTEAMSNRVTDYYWLLLGRAPDTQGLNSWTALLQHGTRDETLLGQLAGSTEYWNDTQAY